MEKIVLDKIFKTSHDIGEMNGRVLKQVRLVEDRSDAILISSPKKESSEVSPEHELFIKCNIYHENLLIPFKYIFSDSKHLLLFEYFETCTMAATTARSLKQFTLCAMQLLRAYYSLHSNKIIHCDVRLENYFLTGEQVQVSGYQFARSPSTSLPQNPSLIEFERISKHYWFDSELFLLGLEFYRFISGVDLRNKMLENPEQAEHLVTSLDFSKISFDCPMLRMLISDLLQLDPSKRIGWKELFDHALFSFQTSELRLHPISRSAELKTWKPANVGQFPYFSNFEAFQKSFDDFFLLDFEIQKFIDSQKENAHHSSAKTNIKSFLECIFLLLERLQTEISILSQIDFGQTSNTFTRNTSQLSKFIKSQLHLIRRIKKEENITFSHTDHGSHITVIDSLIALLGSIEGDKSILSKTRLKLCWLRNADQLLGLYANPAALEDIKQLKVAMEDKETVDLILSFTVND